MQDIRSINRQKFAMKTNYGMHGKNWIKGLKRRKTNPTKKKTSSKKLLGAQDSSISEMLCRLLKQQSAPEIEIDVFDGNPVEFHYFMAVFKEVVKKRVDDERGKLTRWIKYAKGDAKDMVKNCIQLLPEDRFKTAKHLLNERYRDANRIIVAHCRENKQWPQIKSGDAVAYQKLQNLC